MGKNKVIEWIKHHKAIIIGSIISIGIGSCCIYYKIQSNLEGSRIWFKNASLDDLDKYREKVQYVYMNSGTFGLSDNDFGEIQKLLFYIDKQRDKLKPKFDGLLPQREHGWYLPEKD